MSANRKRLCVHYLTYLGSGEKPEFLLSVRFFHAVLGLAVAIFGQARSFSDRDKQSAIQSYIFAPVKKNGVLTRINISVMEIVTIEKKTFELWKQRFENFVGRVDTLCVPLCRKHDKWLDNCETCRLLNVSARTMQTYRDTGRLPYSQINGKIYYKAADVEVFLLDQVRDNSKK
ncbi:hypothetical protein HMPREF9446_02999 [Bacteroides fluxus YIT 12057]|uniref:Helix-turn-helix domain-containing protein n=2 Tax=Bacteroides fluxus TaxID=626930 RepID=F3PW64_9BACE|nr:hypothetical protein HMPREF9446_02999 [Bacteroides fluxus YIT 12057]